MAGEGDKITLEVTLENGQFKISAKEVTDAIDKIKSGAKSGGDVAASGMNTFSKAIGAVHTAITALMGLAIVKFLVDIGKAMMGAAERAHENRLAFTTLTGSAETAAKTIKALHEFTDNTTFEFKGVADTAKQLLAVGVSNEQLIPTLQKLADASQGSQERFESLAFAYSRAAATGLVTFRELRTLTMNQVPIVKALADVMGILPEQVIKLAREGKISFKDLDAAFTKMTTGGGVFAGNMAQYAEDLGSRFKVLKDRIQQALGSSGEITEGPMRILINLLIEAADKGGWLSTIFNFLAKTFALFAGFVSDLIIQLRLASAEVSEFWNTWRAAASNGKEETEYLEKAKKATKDIIELEKKRAENMKVVREALDLLEKTPEKQKKGEGIGTNTIKKTENKGESADLLVRRITSPTMTANTGTKMVDDILASAKRITDARIAFDKAISEGKMTQSDADRAMNVIIGVNSAVAMTNAASNLLNIVSDTYKQLDQMEIQHLEDRKTLGNAWIQYMMEAQLAEAGIVQKTKSQQYAEEIQELTKKYSREASTVNKQALRKQIAQKQQDKKEAEIREEADKKKNLWDAYMEFIKHRIAVQQFERQKQMQMASVGMSMASGIAAAWAGSFASLVFPPAAAAMAAVMTVLIAAMGATQLALISQQRPPMFAGGGYIMGSPQGTNIGGAIAGERNNTEMIANITDAEQSAKAREALWTDRPTAVFHFHGPVVTDSPGFMRLIKKTLANSGIQLVTRGAYHR